MDLTRGRFKHQPGRPRAAAARALATLLVWFLLASAHAAVRFDVFLGYDNILPEASWFPVAFEVNNDGPPFRAVVEVTAGQYDQDATRMVIGELPTGTTKRFVLPVFSAGRYTYSWDARLLDADARGKVRAEVLGIRARRLNSWSVPLMAALTRTPPVFPEFKGRPQDQQPLIARLQPGLFPDNPLALQGLATLYLSSERALDLKDVNQVKALMAWLYGGGHLIVGVEQTLHVTGNTWLRQLVPGELTGMTMVENHPGLQEWLVSERKHDGTSLRPDDSPSNRQPSTRSDFSNPYAKITADEKFETAPLQVAVGKPGDATVLAGSAAQPLVLTAKRGRGQITVLMFSPELEPFLTWKNRPQFWSKLANLPPELLTSEQYNRYGSYSLDGVFGAMLDSKQVRKLPVGWLLLLLVGYLVVIGPLDQWWLKKINRQMLTWLTFPAYVALFSVLIYFIGYKLRAGETEWNELHVVDVVNVGDEADWRGRTYASVYSPVNATYRLASELPYATLRGEFMGGYGGREASRATVEHRANNFQADIHVPVWTSQLYVHDWLQREESPVRVSVARQGEAYAVTVDNRLDRKVSRAKLVVDGRVLELGDLPANQTTRRTVPRGDLTLRSFVQNNAAAFQGAIAQRQQAFGRNRDYLVDDPQAAMAASFISEYTARPDQGQHGYFIAPPGMDLSPVVARGDAVLLGWADGYAPVKPIHKFSPRRGRRDTLLRVLAEVRNNQ